MSLLPASGRARGPSCPASLISTDATARGIDVQGVQLVVNYDAPQYLRTYVHRCGTGLGSGEGVACGESLVPTALRGWGPRLWRRLCSVSGLEELPAPENPDRPSRCSSRCRSAWGSQPEVGPGRGGSLFLSRAPSPQERRFVRMLREGGVPRLERHDTPSELLQPLVPRYQEALSQLERAVRVRRHGGSSWDSQGGGRRRQGGPQPGGVRHRTGFPSGRGDGASLPSGVEGGAGRKE